MNSCRILLAVIAATVLSVGLSKADTGTPAARPATTTTAGSTTVRPIQLALFPPDLQLVRENESIGGFRLEIYGRNQDVLGVDIGLVHEATGNYHGAQFGIVNLVHGDFVGMQLAGIYSETKNHISGFQVGMVNRAHSMSGIQIGFVNFADDMTGFQFGIFNEISSKQTLPVLPLINAKF